MMAVGEFYDDFSQTPDAEVQELLAQAREQREMREQEGLEQAMDAADNWWV
jgi:predicted phosphoribosyltransferase